jgi:hypothetical protein
VLARRLPLRGLHLMAARLHQFSLFLAWLALFAASSRCRLFAGFTQWQHGTASVLAPCLAWPALFAASSICRLFAGFTWWQLGAASV